MIDVLAESLAPGWILILGALLIPSGLAACKTPTQTNRTSRKARTAQHQRDMSRFDDSDKEVREFDLNGDRVPDVWKIHVRGTSGKEADLVLVRKEIDVNFDGRVDVWQYFDEQGRVGKDEMDVDFDSRIDVVTFYDKGQVVRREINAEFDGPPDVYKHYDEGVLVRIERDSDNDGRIDTWEYYEGGALARVGQDRDGDGEAETWRRR